MSKDGVGNERRVVGWKNEGEYEGEGEGESKGEEDSCLPCGSGRGGLVRLKRVRDWDALCGKVSRSLVS
ncbi:hypothetical protein SAMD00023353_2601090 [Rosellinia necatrix]|uniref:Uncharacterized protein n=1 Tax=Rosellinia necatrix TaxID=77044 RepID=A0A1S8A979_ROSNE|nr:hypothetical protein SAMD00023353_2601090 [Rosellinia necatrix]